MGDNDSEHLRNVVLLSHSGAGKTMLSEAMLHAAGVTSRLGTPQDGTTTSDYEPEETSRETSVQTSILPCPWNGAKINVIDTPGYADYRSEVLSGISVADGAIIVVAGPSGVEVGTDQMWRMAEERGLPRLVLINKLDRENADFQRVMTGLTEAFGRRCLAIQHPIGAESDFAGSVNLLSADGGVPDGLQDEVDAARESLIEAIAETDDELTEKYLEGEELSQEELAAGLKLGIASGAIVPVLVAAASKSVGVTEVMDAVVDLLPSPDGVPAPTATNTSSKEEVTVDNDPGAPLAAFVFKTTADPFVGKLSYVRVYGGTFKSDSQVLNANTRESERVGQVFVVKGKEQEPVAELGPGDIGAVAKLSSLLTGHTLSSKDTPLTLPEIEFPEPVYQMAVYPKSKADLDKMTSALSRIAEEDPCLIVTRQADTQELLLAGLGDTHVAVATEKMKRKFGVDIVLQAPKVPYKETIAVQTRVEYKHKKQSGGHGQYGHVYLELDPLPRGAGFEFDQRVVGGSVPREYIPAVEKGVRGSLSDGVVAGYPIVDLKAVLYDGSSHSVDSSGLSFEIAGGHALSKGVREARPILLEPIMLISITVPDTSAGDIIGDLNSRRGRILGMTPQGDGSTLVEAEVPQAEVLRYATDLRSQTQGRGSFTLEFQRLEEVPQHLVPMIVEARERERATA